MWQELNFRSFFNFLGRNKLYTFINIFGLAVSLTFVLLIADYTVSQLSIDEQHTKADRIYLIGSEAGDFHGYQLQQRLTDRYPEIEATCHAATNCSGPTTETAEIDGEEVQVTPFFADTTFFRIFDFRLLRGDREQVLDGRYDMVLSEPFARRIFGEGVDPTGRTVVLSEGNGKATYTVTGVVEGFRHSLFPKADFIVRADRLITLNYSNNERLSNAGGGRIFILAREGADLESKCADMAEYFKEFYWPYSGGLWKEVRLTPLREVYFSPNNDGWPFNKGDWHFVMILITVGAVILLFAVMNYVNLTVAQTGFRAKEMAARRLYGAGRGQIVLKMILESLLMVTVAFAAALVLATAVEHDASQLLGYPLDLWHDFGAAEWTGCGALVVLLGVVSGALPAWIIARYKPIDVVRGTFRYRMKTLWSKLLIGAQNVITMAMLVMALTVVLQIRHLINIPMGYHTKDIFELNLSHYEHPQLATFRSELTALPFVEEVGYGQGTPHSRGNNNTTNMKEGKMISFQTFRCDSAWYRLYDIRLKIDHGLGNYWLFNEQAYREMELSEEQIDIRFGVSPDEWTVKSGGVIHDFRVGGVLSDATPVQMLVYPHTDQQNKEGGYDFWPWSASIRVQEGYDHAAAMREIQRIYTEVFHDEVGFTGDWLEDMLWEDLSAQRRLMTIIVIFTLVAMLISSLGLLAMSTYYIQQKSAEVAVRKVFGSTTEQVLARLVGFFLRVVAVALVIAVPLAWWGAGRWLSDYADRIALSPLIFAAAALFTLLVATLTVLFRSLRAAHTNPIETLKN